MKRKLRKMTILGCSLLAVTAILLAFLALQINDWSRDWTTNTAAITADATDPALKSPQFSVLPEVLAQRILAAVEQSPRWSLVEKQQQPDRVLLHLTRTTRWFHFVDDIHVQLVAQGVHGTLLTAHSQSRVGKGDLGQNPRNLKELLTMVSQTQ